jgi:hypothetical protein
MTTAFGIAAVTATLRELLNDGIVEHNLNGILSSMVGVSTVPPDRVIPASGVEPTQLNLFLHRVSANTGWRNEGLPGRDASGHQRLSNAPLALDLHYLLSAYGAGELHAEVLLGYAMQWLHERPVLTRESIRAALTPSPLPGTPLERALADSGLADQIELVKITPEYLDTEEMSKLWTAAQSHLRPTAAYRATVVLIEAGEPVRAPLPVLTRGQPIPGTTRDEGVLVQPSLEPPLPTLESVAPTSGQIVARLGEDIDLTGHHLDGTGRTVLLFNERFETEHSLPALAGNEAGRVRFNIAIGQAANFPVGLYRVGVSLVRPGEINPRTSNRLAMTIAPEITGLPMNVVRNGAGSASFTLHFHPALRAGQSVALVLGQQEYEPVEPAGPSPWTSLDFVIPNAPVEAAPGHLARLRIDGIDSPIIDRAAKPPVFLNKRIVIT